MFYPTGSHYPHSFSEIKSRFNRELESAIKENRRFDFGADGMKGYPSGFPHGPYCAWMMCKFKSDGMDISSHPWVEVGNQYLKSIGSNVRL